MLTQGSEEWHRLQSVFTPAKTQTEVCATAALCIQVEWQLRCWRRAISKIINNNSED